MKQKWLALLLASAMVLSLLSASVTAVDEKQSETVNETKTEGTEAEETASVQDAEGTISFASLEQRVKENNYTALALGESIKSIDEIDYDQIADDLRDGLEEITDMKRALHAGNRVSGDTSRLENYIVNGTDSEQVFAGAIMGLQYGMTVLQLSMTDSAVKQLEAQYDALEDQLDDIKKGKLQKTNEGVKLQLDTAQNQLIMAAESLYITILSLERSDAALTRSLAALDRTIEEMELRHQMGQISELQLEQVKSGRTQLVSGQQTLQMNIGLMRLQLNAMIGEDVDAKLTLQPLTAVTQEQLDAMNVAADYVQAEKASYETYAAKKARDDAEETYKDAKKKYGSSSKKMEFTQAKHTWQAAQYTYDAAMQSFSLKFRTLYAQVKDYEQVLDAAREALALEQREYEAAQLKYQQGALSHNALLDAENELLSAQDTVFGAESDLFGAYHNYRWAVEHGILN